MEIEKTLIKDCFLFKPKVFEDDRGYFFESFNDKLFKSKTGLTSSFVQDNESYSKYGVIRGLHAQSGNFAQAKLVRVIEGEVLDVVVDIRPDSDTYLEHITFILNEYNKHQVYVPKGCLHGFSVLSKVARFSYKCDNFYNKDSEIGYRFDDPRFDIDWRIDVDNRVVSSKDLELPFYNK